MEVATLDVHAGCRALDVCGIAIGEYSRARGAVWAHSREVAAYLQHELPSIVQVPPGYSPSTRDPRCHVTDAAVLAIWAIQEFWKWPLQELGQDWQLRGVRIGPVKHLQVYGVAGVQNFLERAYQRDMFGLVDLRAWAAPATYHC